MRARALCFVVFATLALTPSTLALESAQDLGSCRISCLAAHFGSSAATTACEQGCLFLGKRCEDDDFIRFCELGRGFGLKNQLISSNHARKLQEGSPTPKPTPIPTSSPTPKPTKSPTKSPSKNPTKSPTKNPTKSPTKSPTKNPTKNPTTSPTFSPSSSPTSSPTEEPFLEEYMFVMIGGGGGLLVFTSFALIIMVRRNHHRRKYDLETTVVDPEEEEEKLPTTLPLPDRHQQNNYGFLSRLSMGSVIGSFKGRDSTRSPPPLSNSFQKSPSPAQLHPPVPEEKRRISAGIWGKFNASNRLSFGFRRPVQLETFYKKKAAPELEPDDDGSISDVL